jgi:hypothetical protein
MRFKPVISEVCMRSRLTRNLIGVLLLATSGALAQDPTKVEPQHYKIAFENENVQVVYIHYGPHERSSLHEHPSGVVVSITDAHLRFTDQAGQTSVVFSKHGEARWFPPFKHVVENLGDVAYDGVYIGIKDQNNHRSARK